MKIFSKNLIIIVASVVFLILGFVGLNSAHAEPPLTVNLGSADSFVILAGSTVTNNPTSVITGNLGLSPAAGTFYDSGVTQSQVTGTIYTTNAAGPAGYVMDPTLLTAAKQALTDAYTDASNRTPYTTLASPELGGATTTAGLYTYSSLQITGTSTLDGQGDPNAVFIFRSDSTLVSAANSVVELVNGASACNVFWVVGTSNGTLGTDSIFKGTIMSDQSIALGARANVEGRLLAFTGAVTLNANVITKPTCAAPASTATLRVIKQVSNLSVATSSPSDFSISVKNSSGDNVLGSPELGTSSPGTLYSLSAGTYTISEGAHALYDQTFGGDCAPDGIVNITTGNKICTVINTEILPPRRGWGVGSRVAVPAIGILKVPNPLALPSGPNSVTYDYTVWNVGGLIALTDVTVADDKCSPVTLLSGDVDSNGKLDTAERWKYRCSTTLSTTTTNTAIATGYGDDSYRQVAIATAIATVSVGTPVVDNVAVSIPAASSLINITPPLINIVKVPSRLTPFAFGGGDVTYTYTVTNPGVVAMHDVVVTDDKCAPVSSYSGDANNNNLLDPDEAWIYTCQTNVSVSTTNTATVLGKANGFTALGYAVATVLVSVPGLPNTGFPPKGI